MKENNGSLPPPSVWAYGYEITPPLAPGRIENIESLVQEEHSNAKRGERTWEGRLVVEEQVTHILVVSDSPNQDLEVNRKLEAELKRLNAAFVRTAPLALGASARIPPA
jgi:hypothetical protein